MAMRVMKELRALEKQLHSTFRGQLRVESNDEDNLQDLKLNFIYVCCEGVFAHAKVTFEVSRFTNYPEDCPNVRCTTLLLHPNICYPEEDGDVCLNILDDWKATFTLEDLAQGLLFLLYNPNHNSPLNSDAETRDNYAKAVKHTLLGEPIPPPADPRTYFPKYPEFPRNLYSCTTFEPLTEEQVEEYRLKALPDLEPLFVDKEDIGEYDEDEDQDCDGDDEDEADNDKNENTSEDVIASIAKTPTTKSITQSMQTPHIHYQNPPRQMTFFLLVGVAAVLIFFLGSARHSTSRFLMLSA